MASGWRNQWWAWNRGTTSAWLGLGGNHRRDSCKLSECKSQSHKYTGLRRCVPTGVRKTCPLSWSSAALRNPIHWHVRSCFWMCAGLAEHPTINQHRCTKTLLAVMMLTKERLQETRATSTNLLLNSQNCQWIRINSETCEIRYTTETASPTNWGAHNYGSGALNRDQEWAACCADGLMWGWWVSVCFL